MTTPPLDSMPEFRPSWALPILAGAGGAILWHLLSIEFAGSLGPDVAGVLSCCGCCSFPIVIGALPALIAFSRDPELRSGEGFTVSFIGVGAGTCVMLVVLYMQVSLSEFRDQGAAIVRESLDAVLVDRPDLELTEEDREGLIEFARTIVPYLPLGIAMIATLLSGVCGMISVILMRGRRRRSQSTTSE